MLCDEFPAGKHIYFKWNLSARDELEVYTSCTVLMPLTYEPIRFTSAVDWWDQYHISLSCRPKWLKGGEINHTSAFMLQNILIKQYTSWWKRQSVQTQSFARMDTRHIHTLMLGEVCSCQSNKSFQKKSDFKIHDRT